MRLLSFENNQVAGRTIIRFCGLKMSFINKKLAQRPDYSQALRKLKDKYNKKEKIRVGFLVSENSKWNAESLYNLLEENENFEPVILITLYTTRHLKKDFTKTSVEDNYKFFERSGKRVLKVYDEAQEKYLNIKDFDIDILFYQQPWGIDFSQWITNVSKDSICCYYPYGISVLESPIEVRPFHEQLFQYFIPNKETEKYLKKFAINKLDNLNIIGYPKLDIFNNLTQRKNDKKTIIYAPHHSWNRRLRIGTFPQTGVPMLEYAKKHKEFNWIFKPHPDLKEVLYKDKKFGKDFCDEYYKQWSEIGVIYDKGNYFEQFMTSDILITDCDAFLLEYMPTLNPIIRLDRLFSTKLSSLGKAILKGVYRVYSFKECCKVLEYLYNSPNDRLLEKRQEITNNILRKTRSASANIVKELEKLFI